MKTTLRLSILACVGLLAPHAPAIQNTAPEPGYQTAAVVTVTRHFSDSNYVGGNPVDAPLQFRNYSYDIGIRVNCTLYVGRYESETRYLPSLFTPHHDLNVLVRKHVISVILPFNDDEVTMGIVAHKRLHDCLGAASTPSSIQMSHPLSPNHNLKGELV